MPLWRHSAAGEKTPFAQFYKYFMQGKILIQNNILWIVLVQVIVSFGHTFEK